MKQKSQREQLADLLSQIRYTTYVTVERQPDKSCYRATAKELKIWARGDTPDQAVINLDQRKQEYMLDLLTQKKLPPMPGPDAVWGVFWGEMGDG